MDKQNIKVVIGSNFGDEGKGLMTDYFAYQCRSKGTSIVVRFNGGAQAGHTVVMPDGRRFVFGHFGSGSLEYISTYLSKYFIVNPLLFKKEYNDLYSLLGYPPRAFVNAECPVTTPYDMMINQIVEGYRGTGKHGSCGVGINETLQRNMTEEYCITASDLTYMPDLVPKLRKIKDEYVYKRLGDLGVKEIPEEFIGYFKSEQILIQFVNDVEFFINKTAFMGDRELRPYNNIIFEGAQGLLLDEDNKDYFPHVTHSHTGMKNVGCIIENAKINSMENPVEIVYVTRCYMTRHGAGPFYSETDGKPYPRIEDKTNVPNPYQDTLRYGILDMDLLKESIEVDLTNAFGIFSRLYVAVTCLDQIDDKIKFIGGGKEVEVSKEAFLDMLRIYVNAWDIYTSYGETRETIKMGEK